MPRTITVKLTFDDDSWDGYADVCDDLMMNDLLKDISGIGYKIITESEDEYERTHPV